MDHVKVKEILDELFNEYSQYDYEGSTDIEKLTLIIEGLFVELENLKNYSHTILWGGVKWKII